jgi:hypothetical protein
MASKIDKDTLKKNLFWILLGVFVVLWLAGVGIAVMPGDDKAAKEYTSAKSAVDSTKGKGVKTPAYQEPWHKHGQMFSGYKAVIWEKAWKQQEAMYDWPASMPYAARPLYPTDAFVRDATGQKNVTEDVKIRNRFPEWYHEQFEYLPDIVVPAKFNGGFAAVFPEQTWVKGSAPTQEEVWLAQEDFWVKRELLWLIRQAIDSVALFREVPAAKDEKPPEGAVARRVFRNANWELTLFIEKPATGRGLVVGERSTIKNINVDGRTQVLANSAGTSGLPFRIQQQQGSSYKEIRISGEPLPFEKEAPICPLDKDGKRLPIAVAPVDLDKPIVIEQLLDWELSPIRRIDTIALARHSHRTVTGGLKVNPELKALEPVEAPPEGADAPAGGAPGGAPGGRPGGMQMGGGPGPGGPGPGGMGSSGPRGQGDSAAAAAEVTTVNKIPRDRYLHVTPQARHLPVVLRLVVDQAHIHDILASISNSRLRMQITQVSFHHVTGVTRASLDGPAPAGNVPGGNRPGENRPGGIGRPPAAGGGPMGPGPKGPGPMGPGSMTPPPGMMMPQMPGSSSYGGSGRTIFGGPRDGDTGSARPTGVAGTSTARTLDNARLVELSIYAIASLYDRYPPREKKTTTPETAPADAKK